MVVPSRVNPSGSSGSILNNVNLSCCSPFNTYISDAGVIVTEQFTGNTYVRLYIYNGAGKNVNHDNSSS